MFTVCPKCALTLVVTAADLKVGQGYVRCGRCSNVFNALVGLTEERHQSARQAAAERNPARQLEAEPEPGLAQHTEPEEAPGSEELDPDAVPDSALEFNADSTDVSQVFIEPRPGPHDVASGTFETIVLEADDLLAQTLESETQSSGSSSEETSVSAPRTSESRPPRDLSLIRDAANDGDAEALQAANDASLDHPDASEGSPGGFDRQRIEQPRFRPERASEPQAASSANDAVQDAVADGVELAARPESSRLAKLAWAAGSGLLLIALAAQLVHHNRHTLAVDARFREPLAAVYGAFGLALAPRWDLSGYDVRQLGATAGSGEGGMLTVRASVQNGGPNPQPLPLLRVTVQDRFGNRIAARDVPPAAYASRAAHATGFLDAGERIDAEIRLADPGPNAVGFELDACLPIDGGQIACANEQRTR